MGSANYIQLAPPWVLTGSNPTVPTGMVLDGTTEKLGIRYVAATTSPITGVDIRFTVTGAPGNFKIGVFADLNGSPDDATQLGGYTAEFAAPATGVYTGLQTLGTNTGNLVIGTAYWIVIEYSSGTCDGSNYLSLNQVGGIWTRCRHHNGTNWTTTASAGVGTNPCMILKHANDVYDGGLSFTAQLANSADATDIFVSSGDNKVQGLRFKVGAQCLLRGVLFLVAKAGTPEDLLVSVHAGDAAALYSITIDDTEILTNGNHFALFASPVLLPADTYIYVILSQAGTSTSNDYDVRVTTFNATYIGAMLGGADMRFVHGTLAGNALSSLTVSTTEFPTIVPLVSDLAADLDQQWGPLGATFEPRMNVGRLVTGI